MQQETPVMSHNDTSFSVFQTDFDPHHRAKQCIRVLKLIQANQPETLEVIQKFGKHPSRVNMLTPENQKYLLDYAQSMITRIKRSEIGLSTFEKNLTESWDFCLALGNTNAKLVSTEELKEYWERQLKRYENKEISHATLGKYLNCLMSFFQFVDELPMKKKPERLDWITLPKKPKAKLEEVMPSQLQIKQLIDAVYLEGKKYSVRDQAILALCNDSGARISEILSMKNKHIREEENYLVISFPESKTTPRTVISFMAKPFLESWAKISPNKNAGPEAYFFCKKDGSACTYAGIIKSFKRALKQTQIPWKTGKSVHFFRSLCSSRFYDWPYTLKHAWFGWSYRDHEAAYTKITHNQFVNVYFDTLKKENNPFMQGEDPFWSEEKIDQAVLEKLLERDEFKVLLRQMIRQVSVKSTN